MIDFRPITLSDKELIESFTLSTTLRTCNLSFANMYCWQPTFKSAWAIVDGYLLIRFNIEGNEKLGYMQPIKEDGSLEFADIIPQMAQDAHAHANRLRIIDLTESGRESLNALHKNNFALHSDLNFEDYIYTRNSLRTLSGKRLQPKRNHINKFAALYPNYEFHAMTSADFEACLKLDCRWRAAQIASQSTPQSSTQNSTQENQCNDATPERNAMLRAFENFESLGLRGGTLYVDGELVAFTYGSPINHDTFCTHIEKGLVEFAGCYAMINKLFAESLPEQYIYINREEDLGIEGLRRAKQSYYPDHLQVKYTAIYLHHDEMECKRLWQRVFGDEDSFIDEFLIRHYSQRRMLRVVDSHNSYLSMLHIIPFESDFGRVAYIYGVATHPEERGKGYARQLMGAAMEQIQSAGYIAAMLIPSEDWLHTFYAQFGFEKGCHLTFESYNNFDFGTGDSSKDRSMICSTSKALKA